MADQQSIRGMQDSLGGPDANYLLTLQVYTKYLRFIAIIKTHIRRFYAYCEYVFLYSTLLRLVQAVYP
jgi:hypothetical protein